MSVGNPGDDERATVDLGPRPELRPGHDADPGDLGDDSQPEPTQTVSPNPIHAQPTQRLAVPRGTTESSRFTTTTTSPSEAMRLEELSRSQIFLKIAIVTALAGLVVAILTNGDPTAFRLLGIGCVVTVLGAIWMLRIIRDPEIYTARRILPCALVIALGSFGGVYYWGVASPVAAMITYGIYFFSLGSLSGIIGGMYVLVALVHAALASRSWAA